MRYIKKVAPDGTIIAHEHEHPQEILGVGTIFECSCGVVFTLESVTQQPNDLGGVEYRQNWRDSVLPIGRSLFG